MSLTKFTRPKAGDLYFDSEIDRFEKYERASQRHASVLEWEAMRRQFERDLEIQRLKLHYMTASVSKAVAPRVTKGLRGTAFVTLGQPGTSKTERLSTFFRNLADGLTCEWS